MTKHITLLLSLIGFAYGQAMPKVEVATVKLAPADAVRNYMVRVSPRRVSIASMTLTWLVYTAYGEGLNTSANVKGGPDWRNQTGYAIELQSDVPATLVQFRVMLRTVLEDRFGLKIHTEQQTNSIYVLVRDRGDGPLGPKIKPWDGTCANGAAPTEDDPAIPRCLSGYRPPGISLDGATMFSAAEVLSLPQSRKLLGTVVQDRTGLAGRYKLELEYDFNAPQDATFAGPSLFTAIREQWGLKLEKGEGPLKLFVIDSVERPTEN